MYAEIIHKDIRMHINNQYKLILTYLKSHRSWCWITLILIAELLIFALQNNPPTDSYGRYVAETSQEYKGLLPFIVFENSKIAIRTIILGTVPFGFGVIFGSYMTITSLAATAKWLLPAVGGKNLFLCSLPHGLFEIAAIIFSILLSALWCRAFTSALIRCFLNKPVLLPLKEDLLFFIRSIVLIMIPLILFSALMEVTVSRWIAGMLL